MNSMLYVWRTSYKGSEKKYISDYQKISFWIFFYFRINFREITQKANFYWRGFPCLIPWFGSYKTSFMKRITYIAVLGKVKNDFSQSF